MYIHSSVKSLRTIPAGDVRGAGNHCAGVDRSFGRRQNEGNADRGDIGAAAVTSRSRCWDQ
jgi:hypothetical protein